MRRSILAAVLCLPMALAGRAERSPTTQPAGETPTVEQIVERTNRVAYYLGADGRANVTMTITDPRGAKRVREMTILRWDAPAPGEGGEKREPPKTEAEKAAADRHCGDQKLYVYFERPPDVAKTAFLVWKHLAGDDDRWLYIPALDNVKRIATAQKRTSFVGSDFFYEDVSGRNIAADAHELVETTKDYYVLKNTPKDEAGVEFAYFKMWIMRGNYLVRRITYHDKDGKSYREYNLLKWDMVQGYPTTLESEMRDIRTGGKTVLEYKGVKYDIGLPESIFTERYLRRAPRKYLE